MVPQGFLSQALDFASLLSALQMDHIRLSQAVAPFPAPICDLCPPCPSSPGRTREASRHRGNRCFEPSLQSRPFTPRVEAVALFWLCD